MDYSIARGGSWRASHRDQASVQFTGSGTSPRISGQTAQPEDPASPFASLLDSTSDPAPAPPSAPASPPSAQSTQSSSAASSQSTQQSSPNDYDSQDQAGTAATAPSPSTGADGAGGGGATPAAGAKKGGKSSKTAPDSNDDAPPATVIAVPAVPAPAPRPVGIGADLTVAPTTLPGDPSANPSIPAVPQPVAAAAVVAGNDPSAEIAQLAAAGNQAPTGAPAGKTASAGISDVNLSARQAATPSTADQPANPTTSISGTATTPPDDGDTPAPEPADAADPAASASQPTLADIVSSAISSTNPGQPNARGGSQPLNANCTRTSDTPTNHGREPDVSGAPTEFTSEMSAAPKSQAAPNQDGPAGPIADVAQKLAAAVGRHSEPAAADTDNSTSNLLPDGNSATSAQPPLDGSVNPSTSASLASPATVQTATTNQAAPAVQTAANPAAVPIAGLAVAIAAHAEAGSNSFEIRLDPPELGRIDVRLDVDREGKVTSHVMVDRPETLDMLRSDAPGLQRSLEQSGLKTSDNGLQFSLRDQGNGGQNQNSNNGSQSGATRIIVPDQDLPPIDAIKSGYGRTLGGSTGIDIRV